MKKIISLHLQSTYGPFIILLRTISARVLCCDISELEVTHSGLVPLKDVKGEYVDSVTVKGPDDRGRIRQIQLFNATLDFATGNIGAETMVINAGRFFYELQFATLTSFKIEGQGSRQFLTSPEGKIVFQDFDGNSIEYSLLHPLLDEGDVFGRDVILKDLEGEFEKERYIARYGHTEDLLSPDAKVALPFKVELPSISRYEASDIQLIGVVLATRLFLKEIMLFLGLFLGKDYQLAVSKVDSEESRSSFPILQLFKKHAHHDRLSLVGELTFSKVSSGGVVLDVETRQLKVMGLSISSPNCWDQLDPDKVPVAYAKMIRMALPRDQVVKMNEVFRTPHNQLFVLKAQLFETRTHRSVVTVGNWWGIGEETGLVGFSRMLRMGDSVEEIERNLESRNQSRPPATVHTHQDAPRSCCVIS